MTVLNSVVGRESRLEHAQSVHLDYRRGHDGAGW